MADYSFIAQPQVPDSFKTIGSMMNIANQAQQLRTSQQEYQRGGVALEKEQALLQPAIRQGQANATTAEQGAAQAKLATMLGHVANGGSQIAGMWGTGATPDAVRNTLQQSMQNAGAPPEAITQALSQIPNDPAQVDNSIVKIMQSSLGTAAQLTSKFPASQMHDFGGVSAPVATGNPNLTGVQPGTQQGIATVNSVQPGAQRFNPKTDAFDFVGPVATDGPGAAQSQPALGHQKTIEANAGTVADHWKSTISDSNKAAQDIGVLQEVKKYAPNAITGVGGNTRQLAEGFTGWLLSQFPGSEQNWAQENKTNTDLLAKNSTMLAIAGGDTNLAKTMAEAMNPNIHMTPQAIAKAADQVIAQRQMAIVRSKLLEPLQNDPGQYTKALTEFNSHADPRVLQFPDMSNADKEKMHKSMTPRERAQFGDNLRFFEQNGILK